MTPSHQDTIVALATPEGQSAIAVLRLSGPEALSITKAVFKGKDPEKAATHTIHYGSIAEEKDTLDDVVVSLFKAPKSFTKEDVVEISCHGSPYIIKRIIQLLVQKGARYAEPGEFTRRAFLNGRFDLAQAEAVADLIASDSEAAHQAAINQMRGGFSSEIRELREKLINFASMVELELDFSDEDVEFANRDELRSLITEILSRVNPLIESFNLGNVIKNGLPTVIAGRPNAGKSTLLNLFLNEDKAIVTEVPGTTRDFIEDEVSFKGINFRFIDTAGIRDTTDKVESIGVEKTKEKMAKASIIIYLFDVNETKPEELKEDLQLLKEMEIKYLVVGNKVDGNDEAKAKFRNFDGVVYISASEGKNIDQLKEELISLADIDTIKKSDTIVTNIRHYENLTRTRDALQDVLNALDQGMTGDFLSLDIRNALHYLGEITGEITTEDLLGNIFSKFCIGK